MNKDLRAQIINNARELFLERGYDGVSLSLILENEPNGKISKGAFYHHFESKEVLFKAIFIDFFNSSGEFLRQYLENQNTLSHTFEHIDDIVEAYEKWFYQAVGGRDGAHRYFRVLLDGVRRFPDLRQPIAASIRMFVAWIESSIKLAQKNGAVRQDIDPHATAFQILSTLEGLFFLSALDPDLDVKSVKSAIFDNIRAFLQPSGD